MVIVVPNWRWRGAQVGAALTQSWSHLKRWWAKLAHRQADPQVAAALADAQARLDEVRSHRPDVERLVRQMHRRGVDSLAELIDDALSRSDGYP